MGIKKARWTDHLNAAEASGLGIAAYAAQHGIEPRALYKLRYKLRRAAARDRSAQSAGGSQASLASLIGLPGTLMR